MHGRFTFRPTKEFYERCQILNRFDSLIPRYGIAIRLSMDNGC